MTIDTLYALLFGGLNAAVIWLCFERDRMYKRIDRLERRIALTMLDARLDKLEQEPKP